MKFEIKETKVESEISTEPKSVEESTFVVTQLPSRFVPYEGVSKLYYRPYKYKEILALSDSKLDLEAKVNTILSGVNGIKDPYTLILPDLEYLSLQRYLASFGQLPKIRFYYKCKKCGNEIEKTLKKEELTFEELKVDKLPFKIKGFSVDVEFTYPDLRKMIKYWNLPQEQKDRDEVKKALYVYNKTIEEAVDLLVSNCTLNDFLTLEQLDRYLYCGLSPVEFICDKCESVYNVIPALGEEGLLILPFRSQEDFIGNRIQFE